MQHAHDVCCRWSERVTRIEQGLREVDWEHWRQAAYTTLSICIFLATVSTALVLGYKFLDTFVLPGDIQDF